jgi:hypothetical protein
VTARRSGRTRVGWLRARALKIIIDESFDILKYIESLKRKSIFFEAESPNHKLMKPEIDRVRNDLETIQKAMALTPSFGRAWIQWLKRDTWLYLWWCLPGFILVALALVPFDNAKKYLGLMSIQWMGLLVAAVMLGILLIVNRKMTASNDGRPAGLVREFKRVNALGWAFVVPVLFYFVWGKQYGIGGQPFMAGLWLLSGSLAFATAMITRYWVFLGWAIPLLTVGLCQPLMHGRWGGVWLGMMFIAVALLSSIIQAWHLRRMEKQYDPD